MAEEKKVKATEMQLEHPLFRGKAFDKMKEPEQLDQLLTITSLRSWLILLGLGSLLAVALLWGIFGSIQSTLPGQGILSSISSDEGRLEAVLFVTPINAQRIREGMPVQVSPATVRLEEYGYLEGAVSSVADDLATQTDMVTVLGNDALAQNLIADGNLIEVRVSLKEDPSTPTGYTWTTFEGPPIELKAFTPVEANVIIEEQRPIELVLPFNLR